MKIALTSQNRKTVTAHAGSCRRFWIYEVEGGQVRGRSLLELTESETFPGSQRVDALITGGIGEAFQLKLGQQGIDVRVTGETDLDRAVKAFLDGSLPPAPEQPHEAGMPQRRNTLNIPIFSKPVKKDGA